LSRLLAFGFGLDAAGAELGFSAGDRLGMQIDTLSGFGFDVGVRDVVGASRASAANRTGFGHKLINFELRIMNYELESAVQIMEAEQLQ